MRGMRMSISTMSGPMQSRGLDGSLAVLGLGDHAQIRLGLEDHPKAGPDQRLVVGNQDADAHAATAAASGS